MARHPGIFVMGEGIGVRGGNFATTTGLFAKYGAERLCDTPICERGFVGLACGAAMTGTRPVIDFMFIDFINDAFGEIVNQIAKMQYMSSGRLRMPVLLRGCVGIGHSAATHHSGSYHSIYSHIPGLRVVMPSTPYDAKGLFTRALRCDDPGALPRAPRADGDQRRQCPTESYEIEFGKARIARDGQRRDRRRRRARWCTARSPPPSNSRRKASPSKSSTRAPSRRSIPTRSLPPSRRPAGCSSWTKPSRRAASARKSPRRSPTPASTISTRRSAGFNGAFAPTPYSPPLEKALVPDVADIVRAVKELIAE